MRKANDFSVEAIILDSREVRAYDRFYSFFSKEKGLIKAYGAGTRKPTAKLAASLEPITKSEVYFIEGRSSLKIIGALIVDNFSRIKESLFFIEETKKIFSVLLKLAPENEPNKEIFEQLDDFLKIGNKLSASWPSKKESLQEIRIQLLSWSVIWKIIHWCGYGVDFSGCYFCGKKPKENDFVFIPEGMVCGECRKGRHSASKIFPSGKEELLVLEYLLKKGVKEIAQIKIDKKQFHLIERVSQTFLERI